MERKAFYDALRPTLGVLTQANVEGFELVLDEGLRRGTALHHLAYILATAWWETGKTMQPVKEAFWLSEAWRKKNLRYFPYYGRGLVQLTWEANYKKASDLYGVDFVAKPDLVMHPQHSVNILFDGMENGWFTGRDLDQYIDGKDEDDAEDLREFSNARRIVNGTDRQVEIGKLALLFEIALKAADYGEVLALPAPAESDKGQGAGTAPTEPVSPPQPQPRPQEIEPEIGASGYPVYTPKPGENIVAKPSPVQQVSKALGGAKGSAQGLSFAGGLVILLAYAGIIPPGTGPTEMALISTAATAVVTPLWSFVQGYLSPRNAE